MSEIKKFEAITPEDHVNIEEVLIRAINDEFRREELSENFFEYIVELQGVKFYTTMSTSEVEQSAKLTIDVLEELKNINNSGLDRLELDKLVKEKEEAGDELMMLLEIWNTISTDQLVSLVAELDRVRRVGGAWALIIANPCLYSAIYAVYDRLVDSFDDEKLYLNSAYFLMRAIMKMHSNEVAEEKNIENGNEQDAGEQE